MCRNIYHSYSCGHRSETTFSSCGHDLSRHHRIIMLNQSSSLCPRCQASHDRTLVWYETVRESESERWRYSRQQEEARLRAAQVERERERERLASRFRSRDDGWDNLRVRVKMVRYR